MEADESQWGEAAWQEGQGWDDGDAAWGGAQQFAIGTPEPEAEKAATSLEIAAVDKELNSFRTASGEIIADDGPAKWHGYTEAGKPTNIKGRTADVHKPLVAAGKVVKSGKMIIMYGDGGFVMDAAGWLGERLQQVCDDGLWRDPKQVELQLYLENGIYNFYLQAEDSSWKRFNLDTGAAEIVLPRNWQKGEPAALCSNSVASSSSASSSGNDRGPAQP